MVRSPEHQPKSLSSYVRQLSHHESILFIVDYEAYEVKKVNSSITHRQNNFWANRLLSQICFSHHHLSPPHLLESYCLHQSFGTRSGPQSLLAPGLRWRIPGRNVPKDVEKTTKNHGKTMVSLGKTMIFRVCLWILRGIVLVGISWNHRKHNLLVKSPIPTTSPRSFWGWFITDESCVNL